MSRLQEKFFYTNISRLSPLYKRAIKHHLESHQIRFSRFTFRTWKNFFFQPNQIYFDFAWFILSLLFDFDFLLDFIFLRSFGCWLKVTENDVMHGRNDEWNVMQFSYTRYTLWYESSNDREKLSDSFSPLFDFTSSLHTFRVGEMLVMMMEGTLVDAA